MEELIRSRIYKKLILEKDYNNQELEFLAIRADGRVILYTIPDLKMLITYEIDKDTMKIQRSD